MGAGEILNSDLRSTGGPASGESIESYMAGIHANLRTIQRRNWWSWSNMVVVVFLLTGAFLSSTLPSMLQDDTVHRADLNLAVRGLVGLVLLFNIYSLWQQIRIKRLYDEIQEKQAHAETLYRLAMFDPLTGLYNRRFAEPCIEAEVLRSRRNGTPLTLLLLDLDEFKQINDRHGHPAGDAALRAVGERLKKAVRGSDLAARLGGDEFLLLLPECDLGQLSRVLARLTPFEIEAGGQKIPVTYSVGWKQWEPGESHTDFLEAADRALYKSKKAPAFARTPVTASLQETSSIRS
jgi:diguanylate cyclase (GGDEF)-like protein